MTLNAQLWKSCFLAFSTAGFLTACATEKNATLEEQSAVSENEQQAPSGESVAEIVEEPIAGPEHRFRENSNIFSPIDWPRADTVRTASGEPGPDYWQQRADYNIDAALNAQTNEVTGKATVTYTNNSPLDLPFIWIHLEQNIFRADSLGSSTSASASIAMRNPSGNGCEIDALRSAGQDLEYHVYDTLARIDLDAPIPAKGGQFVFDVEWRFTIPEDTFRRFGIEHVEDGTIYEVAQWFPAVAVFDDVYGWNTLPYMGTGEFYTNFGDYRLNLTVPRSHIVAATGAHLNAEEVFAPEQFERVKKARQSDETIVIRTAEEAAAHNDRPPGDGPLTWRFEAKNVRTVAWASSDAYIYDGCNLDGVFVQSVYPKEAVPNWSASTQMLRTAIKGYNERWFEYPYPEATNVNGPEGGMEYPMLIFCGARRSERGLYGVTTHEIGHNWFPMIVNTDERRHAWMDEGFNSFINYYSGPDWFGGEPRGRGNAANFARGMDRPNLAPMMTHADKLPRGALGNTQYAKPAAGLVVLREVVLGEERFDSAFREYIRRWAFKSPQPEDFFRTMENVAGADLAWFWRGWFYTTAYLDQSAASVEQDVSESGSAEIALTIHNLAELVMPVIFDVTYEDGSVERRKLPVEVWYVTNEFTTRWSATGRAMKITLDPDRQLPEVNRDNDVWTASDYVEPESEPEAPEQAEQPVRRRGVVQ